jgi:hypothetical protein
MDENYTHMKKSPLHTDPATAERKAKLVRRLGPDSDGAYRAYGRIDGKEKDKPDA